MNRYTRIYGFTVIEVLSVVAIIGILGTTLYWFSRPALLQQQVADASSQLMRDMERMRSTAAKTSRDARITIYPSNPSRYRLRYWNGSELVYTFVNMPNGTQLYLADTESSLVYSPPYGEFSAANRTIYVNPAGVNYKTMDGQFTKAIYVVGVTGKAHQ